MKKNPWANTYIRQINFPRFPFQIKDAIRTRNQFAADAYVKDGVVYWKSNNRVPPDDILVFWDYCCFAFDLEKSRAVRDAETSAFLAEYRERMKNHVPDGEELYEMRAAFGTGVTVVNAVTGQKIRL